MMRNYIRRITIPVLFCILTVLITSNVYAVKSGLTVDQAITNHWMLQGPVPISQIQGVLRSFSPRVQHVMLSEARLFSQDMNVLKTSMDTGASIFSPGQVKFTILPGSRPKSCRLQLRVNRYMTRYVPRLRKQAKATPPVYTTKVSIGPKTSSQIDLPIQKPGVYQLSMVLQDSSGKEIASRKCWLAIRYEHPFIPEYSFKPDIPDNRPLFTQYYFYKTPRTTIDLSSVGMSHTPEVDFPKIKKLGYDGIHIIIHWDDLEIFPNGFDFHTLDHLINLAGKYHLDVDIWMIFQSHRTPYWYWNKRMVNQNGQKPTKQTRFDFVPPLENQVFEQGYIQMLQKLIYRYNHIPYVLGYYLGVRTVEWAYPGSRKNKDVFDYSRAAQKGFRHYLRSIRGWSIDQINHRYNTHFKTWNDIKIPKPIFNKPDTRHWWWDFVAYKKWAIRNIVGQSLAAARQFTNKRLILSQIGGFGPIENIFPVLKKYSALGGICSSQVFYTPMVYNLYSNAGLQLYAEPAGYQKNSSSRVFFNLMTGGHVINTVGGIPNFPDMKSTVKYKSDFDKRVQKILPLIYHQPRQHKKDIALFFSYDSAINSSKSLEINTWHWFRLFAPLVKAANYTVRSLSYATDASPFNLTKNGLLIDTGSHMLNEKSVENLISYAHDGGTIVISIYTGEYLIGHKGKSWSMLRKSGLNTSNIAILKGHGKTNTNWPGGKTVVMNHLARFVNLPDAWQPVARSGQAVVAAARPWGKGQIILMSGRPATKSRNLEKWINTLADLAGCRKRMVVPLNHHKVRAMRITDKGKTLLILQSNESKPVTVKYRCTTTSSTKIKKPIVIQKVIKPRQVLIIPVVSEK